jgi:hypothetical protein
MPSGINMSKQIPDTAYMSTQIPDTAYMSGIPKRLFFLGKLHTYASRVLLAGLAPNLNSCICRDI